MNLIRLKDAIPLFFKDTDITVRVLRAEAAKGRLKITQIGHRDYVTEDAIREMIVRCQKQPKPACSSKESKVAPPPGTSGTASSDEALAAALQIAKELRESSKSTRQRLGRRTLNTARVIKLQLQRS